MKLVANIQLKPDRQQARTLQETLERCNAACDWISLLAHQTKTFKQFALHKLCYQDIRQRFGLTAQVAVRCIAKVADAYKAGSDVVRTFRKQAAQPFDDRIFRFRSDDLVSLWTTAGRLSIPYVCGDRQRTLLPFRKGEVDLMLVRGKWYLAIGCDVPEPEKLPFTDVLGIDLGIVNLAFDSQGERHTGEKVEDTRRKYDHRRRNLQRRRTESARKKLRKLKGRQARFQRDTNHCISKAIVLKAQRSGFAIGLENLKGIRTRVKARRRQRRRLHNWPFRQLRSFIEYKAQLAGIPVIPVDPRNTSRECPQCGQIDERNRKSQSEFSCRSCGVAGIADFFAAQTIAARARAHVKVPMVGVAELRPTSPTL
jgi:IS605 OrfB family transposase